MADVAALRRDLRRRKILENCENRLRKLTAVDRIPHKDADTSIYQTSKEAANTNGESDFTDRERQTNCEIQHLNLQNTSHIIEHDEDDSDECGYQHSLLDDKVNQSSNIQTLPKILSEKKTWSKVKSGDGARTVSKSTESSFLVDGVLSRKRLSLLLAIFGHILVLLFGHNVLNKCIILCLSLQFGMMCLAVLSTDEQQQLPQGLLFKVLTCSGFKFSAYFVTFYKAVGQVLEDIAVFLFTFFMCYWWINAILHILQVDLAALKTY